MLKYNAFLYAGDVLLDILRDRKGIVFSEEQKRRFRIGLLCSKEADPWWLKKVKMFFYNSDPFYIGLSFRNYLMKNIKIVEKKNPPQSEWTKSDDEYANKNHWKAPNIQPYFKTCKGISLAHYLSEYHSYIKEDKKDLVFPYIVGTDENIEEELLELAESYLKDNSLKLHKPRRQKKFEAGTQHVRWSADTHKKDYYRSCWNDICKKAYNGTKPEGQEAFFNALMQELDDISASSNKMRIGWDKDERAVIAASFLVTFVTSASAASNMKNDDEDTIFGLIALGLSAIAALFAAGNSAVTMLRSHHAYRETWLRHQLNYSRLTNEIEQFCACIGDYEIEPQEDVDKRKGDYEKIKTALSNVVQDADLQKAIADIEIKAETEEDQYKENIRFLQERIAELRNTDYDNFFSNMDCINYKSGK